MGSSWKKKSEVRKLATWPAARLEFGFEPGSVQVPVYRPDGTDFTVFGPVFEKNGGAISDGLEKLRRVCEKPVRAAPVLALGGVTLGNVGQCIAAGAEGIAAIRMFQENDVAGTVQRLCRRDSV
jgi:thiamine-phosphate pyrophosphorylase